MSTTFDFTEQEADMSCAVTFKNKHYIYGGKVNKRPILQLNDCGLVSIGSLEFDLRQGACGTTNGVIVLCFNIKDQDLKLCRQASSPTGPWSKMSLSLSTHKQTAIATSPGELALVVILKLAET